MLRRYVADAPFATLVLAHGAGAGQSHPFMVAIATRFAARGVSVATFDFEYMAEGRKRPDPAAKCEARAEAALDEARAEARGDLFAGGKSMGGRMFSQLAARRGDALGLRGLVLLGYPLHPPKQPEKLRAAHLPRVPCPMLFVQGTRDAFGGPHELAPHLAGCAATVHAVEGADHSFSVPKRLAPDPAAVLDAIADAAVAWMRENGASSRTSHGCLIELLVT